MFFDVFGSTGSHSGSRVFRRDGRGHEGTTGERQAAHDCAERPSPHSSPCLLSYHRHRLSSCRDESPRKQTHRSREDVGVLTQEVTDVPAETSSNKPALRNAQVHLKHVISQASEEAVPLISRGDFLKCWDCFKKTYGRDPKSDEERTGDQLTGVNALLKRDMVPYVDFGVWGRNNHRFVKELPGCSFMLGGSANNGARETCGLACLDGVLSSPHNGVGGIRGCGSRTDARLRQAHQDVFNTSWSAHMAIAVPM